MRCLICHKLSIATFCVTCKTNLLKPSITKQKLGLLEVYSFFNYQHIEDLLLTKHTPQGYKVYRALARLSFRPFIREFIENDPREIYVIGVDENIKSRYSHVALLTHEMQYKKVHVEHAKLMATNSINYSGKTLQFRVENPRWFKYKGKKDIKAILVDDIVTTGTTLKEATQTLEKSGVEVLFALTLATARNTP